jgi:hypothetical protein
VSVKVDLTFFSASCVSLQQNLSTTRKANSLVQRLEVDGGVQPVAELLAQMPLDVGYLIARSFSRGLQKPIEALFIVSAPALVVMMMTFLEVSLAPVVIRQRAMVHHLKYIEDAGWLFFQSLSSSNTQCGFFGHRFGHQAALIETPHKAGRRTNQPTDGMASLPYSLPAMSKRESAQCP